MKNCPLTETERKKLNLLLKQCFDIVRGKCSSETTSEIKKLMDKLNRLYTESNQTQIQF